MISYVFWLCYTFSSSILIFINLSSYIVTTSHMGLFNFKLINWFILHRWKVLLSDRIFKCIWTEAFVAFNWKSSRVNRIRNINPSNCNSISSVMCGVFCLFVCLHCYKAMEPEFYLTWVWRATWALAPEGKGLYVWEIFIVFACLASIGSPILFLLQSMSFALSLTHSWLPVCVKIMSYTAGF